jgi:carboxylesterase
MNWHGQINRTIWEINEAIKQTPGSARQRRELLRAHFLQLFEYDKAFHVPRDDRTFLFLHDTDAPIVLLLHGSTGTPAEMRELGNHLYAAGISAYCPRLRRTTGREKPTSWEGWVSQAQIAIEIVATCSPAAFVCGLSMGGTVSLIVADRSPLRGLILLSPAIHPRMSLKARFAQLARFVTPGVFYHFAGWTGEVLKAMDHARRSVREINLPLLALQAADDGHLSARGLKFLRRHARHQDTEIHLYEEGSHVLTRGAAKADVFERVTKFVQRNSAGVQFVAPPVAEPDAEPSEDSAPDAISDPS